MVAASPTTKMPPWGAGVDGEADFFAPEGVQGYVERGEKAANRRHKKENRPWGRFSTEGKSRESTM